VIGGVCGYFMMPKLHGLTHSSYDRSGIESLTEKLMGKVKVVDALTEEVAIIAFDYNSHQPRVFSKFAARHRPDLYDVAISDASEASAAAPVYFDPKILGD
jgi:patatin-like phospholipase/acyl hydrolase